MSKHSNELSYSRLRDSDPQVLAEEKSRSLNFWQFYFKSSFILFL